MGKYRLTSNMWIDADKTKHRTQIMMIAHSVVPLLHCGRWDYLHSTLCIYNIKIQHISLVIWCSYENTFLFPLIICKGNLIIPEQRICENVSYTHTRTNRSICVILLPERSAWRIWVYVAFQRNLYAFPQRISKARRSGNCKRWRIWEKK